MLFGMVPIVNAESCVDRPDIKITPDSIDIQPGNSASFIINVKNENNDNCPINNFRLTSNSEMNVGITFSPSTFNLIPQNSQTSTMKVSIPSSFSDTSFEIDILAEYNGISRSEDVIINVRNLNKICNIDVSNIKFKEKNAIDFATEFSNNDDVNVYADVSLSGNTGNDVVIELFTNGNLIDSVTEYFSANSRSTIKFNNKIFTETFNDNIDVKVLATPTCDSTNEDEKIETLKIKQNVDNLSIDFISGNPGDTIVGELITSRFFADNNGEVDVRINLDAYLCKGSECSDLNCGDSILTVDKGESESITCTGIARDSGKYKTKAEITFENEIDYVESDLFNVYENSLEAKNIGNLVLNNTNLVSNNTNLLSSQIQYQNEIQNQEYSCLGNIRQIIYSDSSTSDIEFCPFGCSNGQCLNQIITSNDSIINSEKNTQEQIIDNQPKFNKSIRFLEFLAGFFNNIFV